MATTVFINEYQVTPSTSVKTTLYLSGNSITVNASIDRSASQTVNKVYFCLKRLAKGSRPSENRYWYVRPSASSTSTRAVASIDITTNVIDGNGYDFYLLVGTSSYSGNSVYNVLTPPSGSSNVQNQSTYYLTLNYDAPSTGIFENRLIYPVIKKTPFSGTARKIIFKITCTRPQALSDVIVSYYLGGQSREYAYTTSPDLFEINFDDSEHIIDSTGVYGVFNTPSESDNEISNINITARGGTARSDDVSETPTLEYVNLNSLKATADTKATKTQVSNLFSMVTRYVNAYADVVSEFGITPMGNTQISSDYKIQGKQFRAVLDHYKALYNKLNTLFPTSFPANSTISDMYTGRDGSEVIEANNNAPLPTVNGNFFNNIIWVMNNIL